MDLTYSIDQKTWKQPVAVLRLKGHLDHAFQPEMDDALQAVIDKGNRHFAIDLSGLEYLSSAGIAALVNLRGKLERVTGTMCFFAPTGRVSKVLDVMGMKRAYTFFADEAAAQAAFPEDE